MLDPEIIAEHERFLQKLSYPAKDADALCDVLRALGDLTLSELCERAANADEAARWLVATGARAPRVPGANPA